LQAHSFLFDSIRLRDLPAPLSSSEQSDLAPCQDSFEHIEAQSNPKLFSLVLSNGNLLMVDGVSSPKGTAICPAHNRR